MMRSRCIVLALAAAGVVLTATLSVSAQTAPPRPGNTEGFTLDSEIPTPRHVLGHDLGERFTRSDEILVYMRALAAKSDRVRVDSYGKSVQGRELAIVTISSPRNLENLESILERNRKLADPSASDAEVERIAAENPAVAWFSNSVHGNEPSPAEASMQIAYLLAAAKDRDIVEALDRVVLVLDPCLNPDGHDRYVNWFANTVGDKPDPNPDASEHSEPWPGGRTNHYYFDLNRDWLWLVQPESAQRLPIYRRYLPQLHIDHHEQGHTQPYFLGPGDDPYNTNIPAETRRWIDKYGRANADAFDHWGYVYSTKERFDYLYPGYGKVMPVYHGAVGMLSEKGGHTRAGLAIELREGKLLTLEERIRHNVALAMSNYLLTEQEREGQLKRFRAFFADAAAGVLAENEGAPAAFIISGANAPERLSELHDLLVAHGIRIERTTADAELAGLTEYGAAPAAAPAAAADQAEANGEAAGAESGPAKTMVPAGSWIIRTAQPMGRLVVTLFEVDPEVTDPDTYDITAWNVPLSFGLAGWVADSALGVKTEALEAVTRAGAQVRGDAERPTALIIDAGGDHLARAAGVLADRNVFARFAAEAVTVGDETFAAGSLIVHRAENEHTTLDEVGAALAAVDISSRRLTGGMPDDGPALGNNANAHLKPVRVAILRGPGTDSYSYGQLWHHLDRRARVPYSQINVDELRSADLSEFSVVIVPDISGAFGAELGDSGKSTLSGWVRDGGTLIAVDAGARWAEREILNLKDDTKPEKEKPLSELSWEERRQRDIDTRVPGPLVRADLDATHPLARRMGAFVALLKRSDAALIAGDETFVVARYPESPRLGGVLHERPRKKIAGKPAVTHTFAGRGSVILFADDPGIRGFLHDAMRLVDNAIVFGPSLRGMD